MNSLTVKILVGLLTVLIVTTIGNQIYYSFHDKHETEEAVLTSINEDIQFDGVVVRDEKVVNYDGKGVLDYLYEDGSKVMVNTKVAGVYSNAEAIAAKNKAAELETEIANLKRAQNPGTTNYVQPETIKTKIDSQYKSLLDVKINGNYSDTAQVKSDMTLAMNIYNIVTNADKTYNTRINQLNAQIKELKKQAVESGTGVKAVESGYFVSYTDGYESKLTKSNAGNLTKKEIKNIIKNPIKSTENTAGKMFKDYSCDIVGVFKIDSRISEGTTLKMMVSTSKNVYDVNVESVTKCSDDSNKEVVVLSCDRLDLNLVSSRVLSAQLIFDEYSGLKVPRSAMRFKGGQKGVYVILGKDITFKKIDVIYEGDGFVLSKNTSDDDYLLLYDQILLEVVSDNDVQQSSKSDSSDVSSG